VIRALVAALLLAAAPGVAGAQVFLASRPNPEFLVGPLFVRVAVTPELGVTLDVLWSLVIPPNKSGAAIAQDLYLLWPNSVGVTTDGAPDPALAAYVTQRGFTPIKEGRLPLFAQSLYRIGEELPPEPVKGGAPFVTFVRLGGRATSLKEALAADLAELVRLRKEIAAERDGLARDLLVLTDDRQRLYLMINERQKRQAEAEQALGEERQRAGQLARQAENLNQLIVKLEQGLDTASRAARSAARSGKARCWSYWSAWHCPRPCSTSCIGAPRSVSSIASGHFWPLGCASASVPRSAFHARA
jgi:hypothetical protein